MSKHKSNTTTTVNSKTPTTDVATELSNSSTNFSITNTQALLATLVIAAISYVFSYFYTSFYQSEEGAQYMNALGFWHNPNSILGNWPKTGWKLIYAPIALIGKKQGVLMANCLFSAFSGYMAFLLVKKITQKSVALPLVFLATQTLWFLLSFKFFSELPTAFILTLALYLFYSQKYLGFSLAMSYVLLLRQEFIFLMPYFAFILIKQKKWIAFFALGLFPILYAIWGWQANGDFLYIIHESQATAALYKSKYPRQGFDHYFNTSGIIFGVVVVMLVVAYIAQAITKQLNKVEYPLIVTGIGFMLIHCLFNLQAYPILTSTGGNLRYLLVVSPIMAALASIAVINMPAIKNKYLLLILLVPALGFVMKEMTYQHNLVRFDKENIDRDMMPVFFAIGTMAVLLFVSAQKWRYILLSSLAILTVLVYIRPKELCCDENFEEKKIVEYIKENKLDSKPIMQNLALFNYYFDKNPWEFKAGNTPMYGDSTLNKAAVGTVIVWDTHYSERDGKVAFKYFQENPTKYKVLKEFRSEDQAFAAVIFEKIAM